MFAVSTDLTRGIGEYPVIKIVEKSLTTVCGRVPQVGSLFPVASLYSQDPDVAVPHWNDFDPRPVDCATEDEEAMQRLMDTFDERDWIELRESLKKVPQPFQCGLFHIEL